MKGYPVGSVVILQNAIKYPELCGVECTIVAPLAMRETLEGVEEVYETDLTHKGTVICPLRHQVRLKKLPPSEGAWLAEKMDKLLNSVSNNVREEDFV